MIRTLIIKKSVEPPKPALCLDLSCFMKKAVFLLVSLLLISACGEGSNSAKANRTALIGSDGRPVAKPTPVELSLAEIGTAASYFVTTASLEPSSDAKINARTSGVVREILHEEGDDVEQGEILLLLEDDDQKLRLKQAQQKLKSAEREYNRLSKMGKAGAVAPNEWEAANNTFLSAKVEEELARLALSYTRVSAPFSGRVVWREVDLGAHVATGNLLFRVMAIKPLLVRVHVPANRIGQVAKQQAVELKVDSIKQTLTGVVELVSPIVDPATGTIKVTLRLDDYPESVRPGDFTEVRMVTDKRDNALLLPSVAIIEERGQHYLFVEEDNKAIRKSVKIGYIIDDKTEILDGLESTDRVISKGQRNLNDGNLLQVIVPGQKVPGQNLPQQARQSKKENSKRHDS